MTYDMIPVLIYMALVLIGAVVLVHTLRFTLGHALGLTFDLCVLAAMGFFASFGLQFAQPIPQSAFFFWLIATALYLGVKIASNRFGLSDLLANGGIFALLWWGGAFSNVFVA